MVRHLNATRLNSSLSKFEYMKGGTFKRKNFYGQLELTYLVASSKPLQLHPMGLRLVVT